MPLVRLGKRRSAWEESDPAEVARVECRRVVLGLSDLLRYIDDRLTNEDPEWVRALVGPAAPQAEAWNRALTRWRSAS